MVRSFGSEELLRVAVVEEVEEVEEWVLSD
jgi:hypothetical protein